jgi:hypothetical protein
LPSTLCSKSTTKRRFESPCLSNHR